MKHITTLALVGLLFILPGLGRTVTLDPEVVTATLHSNTRPLKKPVVTPTAFVAPTNPTIQDLINCESGDRYVVVLDTNNRYSYGYLQFQLGTFRSYGEKYGLIEPGLSDSELIELTKSRDLQIQIATKMLKDGEWWHWKICAQKTGLAPTR